METLFIYECFLDLEFETTLVSNAHQPELRIDKEVRSGCKQLMGASHAEGPNRLHHLQHKQLLLVV